MLSNKKISDLIKRLDLLDLKKVSLFGILSPININEWSLKAELRATAKQKCVISFNPVQTIVHEKINRTFSSSVLKNNLAVDDDGASPVVFDDTLHEFNDEIDLADIIFEELTLILPLYPRFEGAELGSYSVTQPGAKPLKDEDLKPFTQLSELKEKLIQKR